MTHEATSVQEMLAKAGSSQELRDKLQSRSENRVLTNHLIALRGARGLSQEDISKHFGCSQSKISKLENGEDKDLRIEDLTKYSEAIGLAFGVFLAEKADTAIDRIKQHARCIEMELSRLVEISDGDDSMAGGVWDAHTEVLFNLVKLVSRSAEQLTASPSNNLPSIRIETRCTVAPNKEDAKEAKKMATNEGQASLDADQNAALC